MSALAGKKSQVDIRQTMINLSFNPGLVVFMEIPRISRSHQELLWLRLSVGAGAGSWATIRGIPVYWTSLRELVPLETLISLRVAGSAPVPPTRLDGCIRPAAGDCRSSD